MLPHRAVIDSVDEELADGRMVVVLEGGYNLNSISKSMAACVHALLGDPPPGHAPDKGVGERHAFPKPHQFHADLVDKVCAPSGAQPFAMGRGQALARGRQEARRGEVLTQAFSPEYSLEHHGKHSLRSVSECIVEHDAWYVTLAAWLDLSSTIAMVFRVCDGGFSHLVVLACLADPLIQRL